MENITIPEGKALIYIIRTSAFGFAIKFKVFIDNELIGYTKGKNYLYAYLDPGSHQILSKAENKGLLKLNVEAGKTYYVKQKVGFGFIKARNKLALLDPEKGKSAKSKCKLSKSMR